MHQQSLPAQSTSLYLNLESTCYFRTILFMPHLSIFAHTTPPFNLPCPPHSCPAKPKKMFLLPIRPTPHFLPAIRGVPAVPGRRPFLPLQVGPEARPLCLTSPPTEIPTPCQGKIVAAGTPRLGRARAPTGRAAARSWGGRAGSGVKKMT